MKVGLSALRTGCLYLCVVLRAINVVGNLKPGTGMT